MKVVHSYPIDDLIDHELVFDQCVCGPEAEYTATSNTWHIMHHSLDGREFHEDDGA